MSIRSRIDDISMLITPPIITTLIEKLFYNQFLRTAVKSLSKQTKFHLGCGTNVIPGWANIDLLGGTKVIRWNLTTRLPIQDNTIKFVYTEHFIEHINQTHGKAFVAECFRILAPGGILRISTPNLKKIIDEYLTGDSSKWRNLKYSINNGPEYTPCRMVNDAMRLWGHKFIYDTAELTKILKNTGFKQVTPVKWRESSYPELCGLECRDYFEDIILEAIK